jgi:hypothetical protein
LLTACASFELGVRDLLEAYISRLNRDRAEFGHLPEAVQQWHPLGNAHLLLHLSWDQHKHLTASAIVNNLASCVATGGAGYSLTLEAFSTSDKNFKPQVISEILKRRVGIEKVWTKVGRETILQEYLGSASPALTERLAVERLTAVMDRRNAVIHRGRHYYTASESEVRDCARYLAVLIGAIAEVLEKHIVTA